MPYEETARSRQLYCSKPARIEMMRGSLCVAKCERRGETSRVVRQKWLRRSL